MTLNVGARFEIPYPFIRATYQSVDGNEQDGWDVQDVPTWKPSVRNEDESGEGYVTAFADAIGVMVLTVVSMHRPGRFPLRVFFTRTWISPDGKPFGKNRCRMTTAPAFRSLLGGFKHEYVLVGCKCDGCQVYDDHRKGGVLEEETA